VLTHLILGAEPTGPVVGVTLRQSEPDADRSKVGATHTGAEPDAGSGTGWRLDERELSGALEFRLQTVTTFRVLIVGNMCGRGASRTGKCASRTGKCARWEPVVAPLAIG
jgi:hypothetical protein